MKAVGIILSNIHDKNIPELTKVRSIASVPYGGRYRLIDFTLSNMVNSGITKVGVITKSNYQSLMDHVGSGKEWDLVRKNGGLFILPPFSDNSDNLYETRLQALNGVMSFLERCQEEIVVLSDSNIVCNMNLDDIMQKHVDSKADITCVYKPMTVCDTNYTVTSIQVDENDNVVDIASSKPSECKDVNAVVNLWVINRPLLIALIKDTLSREFKADFNLDVIGKNIGKIKIVGYKFDGYLAWITSLAKYYECNMELLEKDVRDELFNQKYRAIYTKVKDSAPTSYRSGAKVKNSFIADGCVVDGIVENSIISRGVTIGKGCVIKNSIILQDSVIMENASLNCVITDKDVVIKSGRTLSGCEELPFFLGKGTIV